MLLRTRIPLMARRRARVEIIPLIDVVFFLLATFVLFTLALSRLQTLPVTLPFGGTKVDPPEAVSLQVAGEAALYWNGELIERAALPARLAHYQRETASPRVIVSGDDRAKFGPLIGVLDEIRRAGITQYSVETRPRPTGR